MAQAPPAGERAWDGTAADLVPRVLPDAPGLAEAVAARPWLTGLEASVTSTAGDGRVSLGVRADGAGPALARGDDLAAAVGCARQHPGRADLLRNLAADAAPRQLPAVLAVRHADGRTAVGPRVYLGGDPSGRGERMAGVLRAADLGGLAAAHDAWAFHVVAGGMSGYVPVMAGVDDESGTTRLRVYGTARSPSLLLRCLAGPIAGSLGLRDAAAAVEVFAGVLVPGALDRPGALVPSADLAEGPHAHQRAKVYARSAALGGTDAEAHARVLALFAGLGADPGPYLRLRSRLGMTEVRADAPACLWLALDLARDRAPGATVYVFHPDRIRALQAFARGRPGAV